MKEHLINRIRCLFSLIVLLPLVAFRTAIKKIDCGDWLHDKGDGVCYQEVQLAADFKDSGNASRVNTNYRETLWEIPGLNRVFITRFPLPDGNWVIKLAFSSQTELYDAMKRDINPPLLDGVPVIVRDTPATYALE